MPTCRETYGDGWSGDYPNCQYGTETTSTANELRQEIGGTEGIWATMELDPGGNWREKEGYMSGGFDPTTKGLDFGKDFRGTTLEDDWQKYFDPYDTAKEERLTKQAGIDIGQLKSAWDLEKKQLGETWDLTRGQLGKSQALASTGLRKGWGTKRGALGAQARLGSRQAGIAGEAARKKSGLAYSGTAAEIESNVRGDVMDQYSMGMKAGKSAYDQAIATGKLGYQQEMTTGALGYQQALDTGELDLREGIVDIGQKLETGTWAYRDAYTEAMEAQKETYLGDDIYESGKRFG